MFPEIILVPINLCFTATPSLSSSTHHHPLNRNTGHIPRPFTTTTQHLVSHTTQIHIYSYPHPPTKSSNLRHTPLPPSRRRIYSTPTPAPITYTEPKQRITRPSPPPGTMRPPTMKASAGTRHNLHADATVCDMHTVCLKHAITRFWWDMGGLSDICTSMGVVGEGGYAVLQSHGVSTPTNDAL